MGKRDKKTIKKIEVVAKIHPAVFWLDGGALNFLEGQF
jgi:hypothetical protein